MSSKLIFRRHHQLLLSGIGMHSTLFERNIVSSFSACPEYSLANVELERLKRFDLWQGSWQSARRRWLS
ncbi:hypothetical protein [Klebsiella quasipneumoniae]|uniref:hypothetical protein n=1 Tax=Klebsiella quasipneumoniae TaxID=1463165 RepID=UPI003D6CE82D